MSIVVQQLDKIIADIQAVKEHASASASSAVAAAPTTTKDVAWQPLCPNGHSFFSWTGVHRDIAIEPLAAQALVSKLYDDKSKVEENAKTEEKPKAEKPKQEKQEKPKQEKPKQEKPKQEKQEKPKQEKKEEPKSDVPDFYRLDVRVGKITSVKRHPGADSLYVETINVGEEKDRQIVSGLVKFVPEDQMLGAQVLVVANLKTAKLRGETSQGMVLAASNADKSAVELVVAPAGARIGERVYLKGEEANASKYAADKEINMQSATNIFAVVKNGLKTDDNGAATFNGAPLVCSAGPCAAKSLKQATIS